MARSEAPASVKTAGNSYPLCLPPPRQSSTLHKSGRYPPTGEGDVQGSARKNVAFGAARVYPVTVPRVKWNRGMHLTPETPTYSMRGCGGLPADAGGV